MAGAFAGASGLICIWQGIEKGEPYLVGIGASIASTMIAFFIGEKNGARST